MKLFLLLLLVLIFPFEIQARSQSSNRTQASNRNDHFEVNAVQFGGVTRFERDAMLTGAVDSTQGTFSVWVRMDANGITRPRVLGSTDGDRFSYFSNFDQFEIDIRSCGNAAGYIPNSSTNSIPDDSTWHHVLSSWDLVADTTHLYIDDVSDEAFVVKGNNAICWTSADWAVGHTVGGTGSNAFNGCMAELYVNSTEYLDLSITANRRKFVSAAVEAINLGNDGSAPTGTIPIIYLNQITNSFATSNQGTGGDFVLKAGGLLTCSTSPPFSSRTQASGRSQEMC